MSRIEKLYNFIHDYAEEKKLKNALLAIPASKELLEGKIRKCSEFDRDGVLQQTYYEHCLQTTKMLIDLKPQLRHDEEDVLMAAALCHDTMAHVDFPDHGKELMTQYHLSERVYNIVRVTTKRNIHSEEDLKKFYQEITEDKLAIMIAMADRGNLVENVYALSVSEALQYIGEIRKYALPMCAYGLENYPEIQMPLSLIMSKIHNLIDVTDIISNRYQDREADYEKQLLLLMEENSRLRGQFAQL